MELNLLVVVDAEYHHLHVGRMGWAIALGRHDIQHICTALLFSSITDGAAPILQGSHVGPKLTIQSGNTRTKIVDIPSKIAYDAHTTLGLWQEDPNGSLKPEGREKRRKQSDEHGIVVQISDDDSEVLYCLCSKTCRVCNHAARPGEGKRRRVVGNRLV
jgi:hypothetical protein